MTNRRPLRREPQLWFGAMIAILTWIGIEMLLNVDIFAHEPHDSYTLQALAWRKGMLSLGQDYPWLELSIFNGDYYVSFPSVPAARRRWRHTPAWGCISQRCRRSPCG